MTGAPKAIRDAVFAEEAAEHVEYYGSGTGALLAAELTPEEQARSLKLHRVELQAKADAATRMRKPRKLAGDLAPFQAQYEAVFIAEKRRRAWPRPYP